MSTNIKPLIRKAPAPDAEQLAEAIAHRISPEYARSQVRLTFGDMFHRWMNDYAKIHMSPRVWRDYERMFANYFSCWQDANVYQIRRGDVAAWAARLGENIGPTTANRARELMRMVYNVAIEWELLPDQYNPATHIRKFQLQPRERFLQADELPRFFAALQTLRYDATRDCLLMCLLTAQRLGNVRTMRWDQIDFTRKVWTIPGNRSYGGYATRTKTGTTYTVPLTPDAMLVLNRRRQTSNSEWVFPNRISDDKPIAHLETAWARLCQRAELKDLRIHDLRRSHASWQALCGENLVAIQRTLNHASITSTSIYARLNVETQREAMITATRAMFEAAGLEAAPSEKAAAQKLGPGFELNADDPWLTVAQVAKLTGYSVSILNSWRHNAFGPPYMKNGHTVRYQKSTVLAWLHGRVDVQPPQRKKHKD